MTRGPTIKLSPAERQLIRDKLAAGMSIPEVAAATGFSSTTVRSIRDYGQRRASKTAVEIREMPNPIVGAKAALRWGGGLGA